jgi:hypothetical protein
MVIRKRLTSEQVIFAINNGKFGKDVVSFKKHVAIILTQSWCSGWIYLKQNLNSFAQKYKKQDIAIFELEYDKTENFKEILNFKEKTLKNDFVPYVRFYVDGHLIGESNSSYVNDFLKYFQLT